MRDSATAVEQEAELEQLQEVVRTEQELKEPRLHPPLTEEELQENKLWLVYVRPNSKRPLHHTSALGDHVYLVRAPTSKQARCLAGPKRGKHCYPEGMEWDRLMLSSDTCTCFEIPVKGVVPAAVLKFLRAEVEFGETISGNPQSG